MTAGLTQKQLFFVEHHIQSGGNGTAAARAAGYKGSTATLGAVAYAAASSTVRRSKRLCRYSQLCASPPK